MVVLMNCLLPFLLTQEQVQQFLACFINSIHVVLNTQDKSFVLFSFPTIVDCFQGVMGLGGEVFHGALHWTISYHLDGGLARPVERTASLMMYNTGLRDGVHLHCSPRVRVCCFEMVHLAHTPGFWLGNNEDIFLIVLSHIVRQVGLSSRSQPVGCFLCA